MNAVNGHNDERSEAPLAAVSAVELTDLRVRRTLLHLAYPFIQISR